MIKKTLYVMFSLVFVLAACAPAAATPEAMMDKPTEAVMDQPTEAVMEKPTEAMMGTPSVEMMETPGAVMADKPTEVMMPGDPTATPDAMGSGMIETPAWFSAALSNARSGEKVSINDFKGKVVLVETFTSMCPKCDEQQAQVKALQTGMGMNPDLVFIALGIDPMENAANLKNYADRNGFDWIFTVSSDAVAAEIGSTYGQMFLDPASAPILVIDRKGQAHPMPFGVKSADDLAKFIEPFLKEGM